MTPLATVMEPGLQTTIQDAGRPGLRHLGVPLSGAADRLSYALATAAAGAPVNAPALECTLTGPTLRFETKTVFTLGGANMNAQLNNVRTPLYEPVSAKKGDILKLGAASSGARTYIAFQNGVAGAFFLGSASTYLPGGFGGLDGRALRQNDRLSCAGLSPITPMSAPQSAQPVFGEDYIIRATTGPEWETLKSDITERFFDAAFTTDHRADRMGARLIQQTRSPLPPARMVSGPVFPGTIQLPPDGAPFLLLADAQTVGGYPRIAQVIHADMALAGQLRPGDRIWFRRVSPQEGRDINKQRQALLRAVIPDFSLY